MALGGAAGVPKPAERSFQRQPLPTPMLMTARLQRQTRSLGFAQALVLTVMGQLSKRFVMQHVHPSFPCEFACVP